MVRPTYDDGGGTGEVSKVFLRVTALSPLYPKRSTFKARRGYASMIVFLSLRFSTLCSILLKLPRSLSGVSKHIIPRSGIFQQTQYSVNTHIFPALSLASTLVTGAKRSKIRCRCRPPFHRSQRLSRLLRNPQIHRLRHPRPSLRPHNLPPFPRVEA